MSSPGSMKVASSAQTGAVASHESKPQASQPKADAPHRLAARVGNQAFTQLVGQGQALSDDVRLPLEARFGEDFSQVRIHDHALAHDSAREHGAKAYTHGENIVFSAQRFDPHRPQGLHLLAHELAHVVQQRRGGQAPSGESHAPTEQAAASAANAVTQGSGPVAVAGASGVGVACEKEDDEKEEEKKVGQASTTVLSQRPKKSTKAQPVAVSKGAVPAKKPGPREQPIEVINEPNKAKGTGAEATVPFDRYAGPDWNHIGGGAETSTSRTNLARRSSFDISQGRQEGTAGIDFIVENVKTGRLVIGEQKATQGNQFNDASAITSSLEANLAHTVGVLKGQIQSGQVHPDQVPALERTIARLEGAHQALLDPTGKTPLPEGVVFELTNVRGEGEQIGKGHIDLLAKKYGDRPTLLDHLLSRTFIRDPALVKARDAAGQPRTPGDPDVVPANDVLTKEAKEQLAFLKSGKTAAQWKAQKPKPSAGGKSAKSAPTPQEQRLATQFKQQQQEARARASAATLKSLQDKRAQNNEPEPRLKKDLKQRDAADRKLARDAGQKAKEAMEAKQQKWQKRAASADDRAQSKAYRTELKKARRTVAGVQGKPPQAWDKVPLADRQRAERLASNPALAPKMAEKAQQHFSQQMKDAQRKANSAQVSDFDERAKRSNQEAEARNRQAEHAEQAQRKADAEHAERSARETNARNRRAKNDQNMSKAAHRLNQAAGAVRGVDAFLNARDRGKGVAESLFEGGKTYLDNTNQLMGAIATFQGRMAQEKIPGDPQGRTQQVYGNDAGDAFFGTLGENIAGFVVPGAGWDQLINGGANLIGAGDDHLKRELPADDPQRKEANLRTGTDLMAELTPSRMFSAVVGAGSRAWYDLYRASEGDMTGADKFGEDGVRGKLGSVIQPWAMLADFAGNLGGSDASTALNQTLNKSEGTTLSKLGNALGDGMYDLGQNERAKAGDYGAPVQGWSMSLGLVSDLVGGQLTFDQALEKAAKPGEDTLLAKAGGALGDGAYKAVETTKEVIDKGQKVWNEDIPALKENVKNRASEVWNEELPALKEEVKERASEVWNEDLPALKDEVKDRAVQEYHEARDKLSRWWNS